MNSVRILQPRWYQSVRSFRSWFRKMGSTESKAALLASKEAEFIQQTVQDNCVVVFSKTTCGYCGMAKRVFSEIGTPYVAVELNKREDGAKLQDVLFAMTGESTVPRVFVNGQCIGGGAETRKLHKAGQLIPLLSQCTPKPAVASS